MGRRFEGEETRLILLDWTKGQKASERLTGAILQSEGFEEVDPSHPLGGKDGGKDILCRKDGLILVGAAYFPRGQLSLNSIKAKFTHDVKGVKKNNADGIVFVTNQELKLGERKKLIEINEDITVEIYHLERLTQVLNVPKNYGIRLEFLDIDVTKEEYLAFIANRDDEHYRRLKGLEGRLDRVLDRIERQTKDLVGYTTGSDSFAFLKPHVWDDQPRVDFYLHNTSQYPVFDVYVCYVDEDEPVSANKGKYPTLRQIPLGPCYTVHPNVRQSFPALTFDMSKMMRLAINVSIGTRTGQIMQLIRCFNKGGEIIVAYKIEAGGKVLACEVPKTVPGYNPDDPNSIF
jgi:hypothetical protein